MQITITAQGAVTLDFINQTDRHIFLTGKAGTGKTTLLKQIIDSTHKKVLVVAPTGIAALNAGGVTMHSMFQLPIGCFLPVDHYGSSSSNIYFETPRTLKNHVRMSREKLSIIRQMEVLIIDEVSMLRSDLLDALDYTLRRVRKNNITFGGVQMLFIGDLMQLPPVVKNEEWNLLAKHYKSMFFFQSLAVQSAPPLFIELSKIFRQEDPEFIALLNRLRDNQMQDADWIKLDSFVQTNFKLSENPGYILLTTHNYKADRENTYNLDALTAQSKQFKAVVNGDFPEKIFPINPNLSLKIGAQVMFVRNDASPQKKYYNGKIGKIEVLTDDSIKVRCDDDNTLVEVEQHEWENEQYSVNESSKLVEKKIIGTFVQYPLRLAWAITVHKSQGLTFSKAALDVQDVFQPGQAYVAFSRLRAMDGLILLSKLRLQKFANTDDVLAYTAQKFDIDTAKKQLSFESESFMSNYIKQAFDIQPLMQTWKRHLASYQDVKENGVKTKYVIWAQRMMDHFTPLIDVTLNFHRFIDQNFTAQNHDLITKKIEGAKDYYLAQLEKFAFDLYTQLHLISKAKKSKTYFNELLDIEEQFLLILEKINNCHALVVAYTSNNVLDKRLLDSSFIQRFRTRFFENTKSFLLTANPELIVAEDDIDSFSSVTKKGKKAATQKVEKVPTHFITFQMLKEGKSIDEIAAARMFAKTTIEGHLAKIIESGELTVNELLEKEKLEAIEKALDENPAMTGVTPYKELLGNDFSFGEIRMVLAHRNFLATENKVILP